MQIEAAKRLKQQRDSVTRRLESLERQLSDAERTGDNEWAKELRDEIVVLKKQLNK